MSFATRLALLSVLLTSPLCAPARATTGYETDYETGPSLACDTQAQVERFVALFTGDAKDAIQIVNGEQENPGACVIRNVAFKRGMKVGMARHGDSAFEIVRILVVGIKTDSGILPVRPSIHFSLFGVKEYAI
jgi:hypothetical protein